jgi:hypothetical protein
MSFQEIDGWKNNATTDQKAVAASILIINSCLRAIARNLDRKSSRMKAAPNGDGL